MMAARTGIGTTLIVIVVVIIVIFGTIGFVVLSPSSSPTTISLTGSSSLSSISSRTSATSTSTLSQSTGDSSCTSAAPALALCHATSTTTVSPASPTGLQLQITLNTTTVQPGGRLTAQISLFNTLATNVSVPTDYSANPNIADWDNYDWLCGVSFTVEDTYGFALFQGDYGAGNLTQAGVPILLAPPVAISCPNRFYNQAYIQNVEFAPNSSLATLSANASFASDFKDQTVDMSRNATTGSCTTSPYKHSGSATENGVTTTSTGTQLAWGCGTEDANSLTGYWTMPSNGTYVEIDASSNATITQGLNNLYDDYFHQFSPGSYTMVAEDMWGQAVFAHFQMVAAASSSSITRTSASCVISGQPGPLFLRVVSDSNETPVAGAVVTATNESAYCGGLPATSETSETFTTNSTEWYSLDSENSAGYSFTVKYQGQTYDFSASLAPVTETCATLFVPSGQTSVSMEEFQTTCPSTTTTSQDASTVGATFVFPISINYSGSWWLAYWVENYSQSGPSQRNILGNLTGSGNYQTTVTMNVVGYVERTLCASATKLDSLQENLTLSVLPTGFNGVNTDSTTASNSTAEVCATMGV